MSDRKIIALTFDDGPNTTTTMEILDILEQYHVKATFFLIGNEIKEDTIPVVKREVSLGCEIENHSLTHSFMDKMDAQTIRDEIAETSRRIRNITGVEPQFFRPPYIVVNDVMYENIDMPFICGRHAEDWDPSISAEERTRRFLDQADDGVLFLIHDLAGNVNTVESMKTVIPSLLEQGYALVTLRELFEEKNVPICKTPGKIYSELI